MSQKSFRRLAVLDRGEGAVRVLLAVAEANRAGRADGLEPMATLAVHAEPAGNAWFAREADGELVLGEQLYRGEPDGRRRSHLLDVDAVVGLLAESGVDVAWLGHTLVGDQVRFIHSCEAAGIAVVGPPAGAVRLIDDRVAFRRAVAAAGLPLLPWSDGPVGTVEQATAAAERLGYPVRLLAVDASGRRGVVPVASPGDLPTAYQEATRRAAHAAPSGSAALLVEHHPGAARRIEVVVLVDDAGTVWTLDVRDTSLQRAHQRVLLEAPAAGVDSELEAALRRTAVEVCRAVGYRNAGAVRFAVDPAGGFHVSGVDARLQLEPALTEELCSLDLVSLRLRLAAGGLLEGPAPTSRGHAIEARLHAEDPLDHFRPTPGPVALVELAAGAGVRVDTGVRVGDQVSAGYEPLLATVTAWGRDRPEALGRLQRALERTSVVIDGGCTDRSFLLRILDAAPLRAGGVTPLLDSWLDEFVASAGHVPAADPMAVVAAAIAAYDEDAAQAEVAFLARAARGRPESPAAVGDRMLLAYHGRTYRLRVDRTSAQTYLVEAAGPGSTPIEVRTERINAYERRLVVGGRRHLVHVVVDGAAIRVDVDGAGHELDRADGVVVAAPGPAIVVSLAVGIGDEVRAGDLVAVLETMKMETSLYAPVDGVVSAVDVSANAQVASGACLVRLRSRDPGDAGDSGDSGDGRPATGEGGSLSAELGISGEEPAALPNDPACRALYRRLNDYLLGYDLAPAALNALLAEQKRLAEVCPPGDDCLAECENSLLDLYSDLGVLYRPQTEPAGEPEELVTGGTQEYLHAFLQWLDADRAGLSAGYRERLLHALGNYGVTGLERTPELEAAVVRLFGAVERVRALTPVVVAILQRRLTHREALAHRASPERRRRYDRLAAAAQGRHQVIADLARDVRFHFYDEPVLESIVAGLTEEMDGHLAALGADPHGSRREDHIQALVACPQPLRAQLLRAWLASTGTAQEQAVHEAVLEVYIRRFYRIRAIGRVESVEVAAGVQLATTSYHLDSRVIHLVVGYTPLVELPAFARAVAAHLGAIPASHEVVLDLVTWRESERAQIDAVAAEVSDLVRACDFGHVLHRLDVTLTSTLGSMPEHIRTQHLTFRTGEDGVLAEERLYRNLHPMLGKRLSLWRLRNFALERLPSAEDIYLFLGQAHDNPKDRRLFALAEVRDLTAVTEPDTGRVTYPMLERVGLRTLAAVRDTLAGIPDRQRPVANRIVLSVRPPWTVPRDQWRELARTFAPLAVGAGLEKVVLRVRMPAREEGGTVHEVVLHVEGLTGGAPIVREEPLGSRPIGSLSEYGQKVLLARRFGAPYPYEIVRLLTPDAATAGTFPRGDFTELELDPDGEHLVPVDRGPGRNTAHLVVGLLTSYTPAVPEGMTRVAILSDPTKGLGNLAEPECRRINAALTLAAERRLPVEWFAVSSGALIAMDSGTENMDWIAQTLRRIIQFTQGGGEINIIVTGINVGGQPYWNAEATMLMHTRGILIMTPASAMVLTGKQALDFSGGVSAEDNFGIGGFDRVMGPNGQGQYFAPTFEEACGLLLRHYDFTYVVPGERFPRRQQTSDNRDRDVRTSPHRPVAGSDFTLVGDVFERNPERKKPFDMRSVMRAVADVDCEPLERWQRWADAENSIVWDTTVGGIPVCMLGLESRTTPRRGYVPADGPLAWTSGTLFPQASRKTARAVNAASGNRPLVVMANLSGFDGSPESMRRWQLEYGAEIGRAVTNFRGPIVFVVVSRYHGGAFVVFSKALNPAMEIAAVEGSYASVIGGAPAAATVFAREVKQRTEKDARVVAAREAVAAASRAEAAAARAVLAEVTEAVRSQRLGEVADEFDGIHTIERALRVGSVDRIISAAEVRPWVIDALERGMAREAARG